MNDKTARENLTPSEMVAKVVDLSAATPMSSTASVLSNEGTAVVPTKSTRAKVKSRVEPKAEPVEVKKSDSGSEIQTWDASTQAQMAGIAHLNAATPANSEPTIVFAENQVQPVAVPAPA